MKRRLASLVLAVALPFSVAAGGAQAADLGGYRAVASDGIDCEGDLVKTYDSVWLGHFTGGYSHSLGPGEPIVLDWRDEKLCYPSKHACDRHMSVMRRQFHRPEGYFTCTVIR